MKVHLIVIATVLSLLTAVSVRADFNTATQIAKSLEQWDPITVDVNDGVALIITKERRLTDQIYRSMVAYGLCMGLFTRPRSLDGIAEVRVLNQFGRQGYVFMGGKVACEEINNMPSSRTELHILGLTRMHTN